jgi:hypothetical protein
MEEFPLTARDVLVEVNASSLSASVYDASTVLIIDAQVVVISIYILREFFELRLFRTISTKGDRSQFLALTKMRNE